MVNRRHFLSNGLLMAGWPVAGALAAPVPDKGSKEKPSQKENARHRLLPAANETWYISHRGVHLRQRVAGENTIESLRLAKSVGFQCVEFDVRFTLDGVAVVIHDETINRTLRDKSGNKPAGPVYVKDLSFDELRTNYVVYTENKEAVSVVPTFEEYVEACRFFKVIPFVEIKEHALSEEQYGALINTLDSIVGRHGYVITSNNKVNDRLRQMGHSDIMVMGILYQTTFDHIQNWGNSIMAISASRFTPVDMKTQVRLANRQGIPTESHADTIDKYNLICRNGIDFISTDALMPEYTGQGQVVCIKDLEEGKMEELKTNGTVQNGSIQLQPGQLLEIQMAQYGQLNLYGVNLQLELAGLAQVNMKEQKTPIGTASSEYFRCPLLLHKEPYHFQLTAISDCIIKRLLIIVIKF